MSENAAAYPPARWRLLLSGYADGATNMAVDEAILRAVTAGLVPPTLRFFGWQPACVTIGYSQSLAKEVDLERCRQAGVDCVRRLTGGRAILHVDELTYSVSTSLDDPRAAGDVVTSYRNLSHGLMAGLALLRLDVAEAARQSQKTGREALSSACFDIPSHYEVTVSGRKLVGSAQVRRQNGLLQHGTLPLVGDITRLVDYLLVPSEDVRQRLRSTLQLRAITLEEALGRPVSFSEAGEALAAGFAQALNLELYAGALIDQERVWVEEALRERFGNLDWNAQR